MFSWNFCIEFGGGGRWDYPTNVNNFIKKGHFFFLIFSLEYGFLVFSMAICDNELQGIVNGGLGGEWFAGWESDD